MNYENLSDLYSLSIDSNRNVTSVIKTYDIENNTDNKKQTIMYLKIKLLNTKIYHNGKLINMDTLNGLVQKVNLKLRK